MIHGSTYKEPAWFTAERTKYAEAYSTASLPSFKYGIAIFSKPPADLLSADTAAVLEDKDEVRTIEGAALVPFSAALREPQYEQLLKKYWLRSIKELSDLKLLALHGAHIQSGFLVHVPADMHVSHPLVLPQNIFADLRFTHVLVVVEHSSSVTIIDQTISGSLALRSHIVEVIADSGAAVEYISSAKLGAEQAAFVQKVAMVGEHATIVWRDHLAGSGFIKSSSDTILAGQGSSVTDIAGFTGNSVTFDIARNVVHQAPQSQSDIKARGVLFENAKAIWRGNVAVKPNAGGSKAYQRADTLLASATAEADTIPVLEVENDRVQAKHGASTSRINQEHLFYLTSRGLSEEEALQTLIAGFMKLVTHEYIYTS